MSNNNFSRRKFITGAAAVGAAGVVGFNPLVSCSAGGGQKSGSLITGQPFKKLDELFIPPLLDKAPDGQPLKAGVVGCGGRGTGAAAKEQEHKDDSLTETWPCGVIRGSETGSGNDGGDGDQY